MTGSLIGLTGGMACGKSAALKRFADLGWRTLDADAICAELYADPGGALIAAVTARWGDAIRTEGKIDKKKIAGLVFSDPRELDWLNDLVHPMAWEVAETALKEHPGATIFDVPLLFETRSRDRFSRVIAVWAPLETRFARCRAKGWSDIDIQRRLNAQWSAEEKLEAADYGLINSGDLKFLYDQCDLLNNKLKEK